MPKQLTCDSCGNDHGPTKSAIIRGVFGNYCSPCIQNENRSPNAGHAQYSRARDKEDNAKDLIQPWDRSGRPNREFINNYPTEAKDMFTPEELKQYS